MRRIPLLISLFLFITALPLTGQNCGCANDGNCPFPFTPNSTTTICYDIEDAFNNNLANPNQGVCGVSVFFEDDQIGGLDLTLISPNGTQVALTGTMGNCNNWTPISTWNILFVPCVEECHPDTINTCEFPCVFDNCPTDCLWPNAIMTGSYHPYSGCLENFNSGPANGQWCLQIENGAQFQSGTIFDFEVILCDQSGFFCCDADAGNLAFEPNLNACMGDSALQLTPTPLYGAIVPDPDLYGYTYAVFSNGSLLQYDSLTDLRSYPLGTYQICGLSYFREDSLGLPAVGSPISAVDIYNNLSGPAPDFCGDIDTNCFIVKISTPPPVANFVDTICSGDEFLIGTTPYASTGIFIDTIQSVGGCDSIVHLDLTVLDPDTTEIVAIICNEEEYIVGNDTFDASGEYEILLQNRFGCDSTVVLNLTVLLPIETNLTETICLGDTVWVGTTPHTETGISSDTLLTVFSNCDSIINLDLTVVGVNLSIDEPDTLTCTITEITLTSNAATTLGVLVYEWTTVNGSFAAGANTSAASVGVNAPGMYSLSVEAANCTVMGSVLVEQEAGLPVAIALAAEPDSLTCTVLSVQLDATTSMGGPNLTFQWTGNVSDPNSPTPNVTEPGIYEVTVTDLDNGCSDTDAIEIFQDIELPVANAGSDNILSCQTPIIVLDGSASTPIGNLSYQWTAIGGGHFTTPTNIPNPQVDEPDAYQLTVTNLTNGCTDTDLVGISSDQSSPLAAINILPPIILNCVNDTVFLDGSISQNLQDVTFEWIGNIAEGQGTLMAAVIEPGEYSLALFNTMTGCADTATVVVGSNYNTPMADAGIGPDAITCTDMSEEIGGTGTSFGANIIYQWTSTPGGAFLPGTDQNSSATVTAPGTYYLTVTNIVSGCTAIDSVIVDDAIEDLDAITVSNGVLTCDQLTFQLDASASIIPPNASYRWINSAGTVLVTQNLLFTVNYTDTFYFILNLGNLGCIDTAMTVVTGIETVPFADAGADMFVDCNSNQAILDGSNSDVGTNFAYLWTALSGEVVFASNTVSPVVEGVGLYQIEVTDTSTGCSTFDTVQVLLDSIACMPIANAGVDGWVGCAPNFTNLQASGSAGPNFSYEWTMLPDSTLTDTGFGPLVSAGTYVFCVTNAAVSLTACDTVIVAADTIPPTANINPFLLALTCPELASCYPLDVTGTSQGPGIMYEWASLAGTFCTPENELNAEVLGAGTYELFVTNTLNGCTAIDNIIVQLADILVNAEIDAAANVQMSCGETETILTGLVEPQGGNLTYLWSTPSGEILLGGNTLMPTVNALNSQDVFYFTVTNNINQCVDVDSIIVFAPVNCKPDCGIAPPSVLDCNNNTVTLNALGSAIGPQISYQWTTAFGNFCGDNTSYSTCVDEGGLYKLTVFWTYPNGAVFDSTCAVTVQDLSSLPIAEAGPNDDLNCVDETLNLNGNGSATGQNITYLWTTVDGNILNGETTLTPEVNDPGTYELAVTDTSTGCFSTDFVEIGEDFNYPNADAGPNQTITCTNSSALLNGSTSLATAIFLWTTIDGNIGSDPNAEDVTVGAAGTYYFTVTNPVNGCSATDSAQVDANGDIPTVNVGAGLDYTCADTVFTIQSVITAAGSGALGFEWTTSDGCIISPNDILQPTFNCPGTYVLTVRDLVTGCSSTATVIIDDETTPPTANAGGTAEINCSNLTLQLNGSASTPTNQLDFEWSTLDGNFLSGEMTAMIDAPGEYKLVVTDQFNQCQDSATVIITIDANIPPVNAGADTTLTCTRIELNLNGNGSAIGSNIEYQWTGPGIVSGGNSLQPLINAPGEYVLKVTDTNNGCVVTDTVEVGTNVISPDANITAPQNLLITCELATLVLNGTTSTPSGNVSYQWTTSNGKIETGVTNPTVTVSSGGTYTLTVTNLTNGCSNQESVTVSEDLDAPFLQVLPAHPLTCDSTSVQLHAIPPTNQNIFSFQWTGPGQILNSGTSSPTVFQVGIYRVTITDETNGCTGDTIVAVTQDISPPDAIANAIGALDCDNLTTTVTGEGSTVGGVTYNWTTTTSGNIATPNALMSNVDAAGKYYLSVKKLSNGCKAIDSTVVVANSLPIDSVLLSFQQPDCIDFEGFIFIDSVFGGTPPYSYSLNDSIFVTYPQFSYLDPGPYNLLVQGVNGCTWESDVTIFYPNEVLVELGNDIYISQGQSADLLAQINLDLGEIANIVWANLPDSVLCPLCLDQVVFPNETTTYRIEVFDTSGCFATDAVTVFVDEQNPFYVPTAFTPNGDNVNDLLIFYAGKDIEKVPEFSIYDRWGNRVFHQENFQPNNPNFGWDGNFDGQPMRPAVFAWKAWVEFKDGKRKVFYGDLTLIR